MSNHVLIIIGSPKNEKSTSNTISTCLEKKLTSHAQNFSKLYLYREIFHEDTLIESLSTSNTIILIAPIYENNVPSVVHQFFETVGKYKNVLGKENKSLFVITPAGYGYTGAGSTALTTCELFAKTMNFTWLGGITIAPATLIEGIDLGKLYANLNTSLELISQSLSDNSPLPNTIFELNSKAVLPALFYRTVGKLYQKDTIKALGKEGFYAKPLI